MKIGIDIGGSHVGVGLVNNIGSIEIKKETDLKNNKKNIEQELENIIVASIIAILEQKKKKLENIELIGIASPGTISKGKIKYSNNLKLNNFDIIKILKKHFNVNMQIRNDAKCAALCEKKYGSLKKYNNSVFLTIGTGIGGAVFYEGKLLTSKKYPAFELGHTMIEKNGRKCSCGNNGCFETYASITALKNKITNEYKISSYITGIELLNIINRESKTSKMKKIIEEYIEDLCIGIANLINIFEPEAVCFGGSFIYYKDIFDKTIQEKLPSLLYNGDMPKILYAKMKNDAGIIGATL